MTTPHTHRFMVLDAATDLFFARQLEDIDSKIYETKYAPLEATTLVSTRAVDPGAELYTWSRYDMRAQAKIMANYATGAPRADVAGIQESARMKSVRIAYGYNLQELRAAKFANVPLDSMRATAAKRGIDEALNKIALVGDVDANVLGLFTQTTVQTYTVPADGTGASTLWANKTQDQILRDMFGIIDQIPTNTFEVERATRLLVPYSRLRLLNSKRMGAGDGILTVLKFFEIQRPDIEIRGAMFLDTAGAGSTARMVAYNPNPENLEWAVAIPFETLPPVQFHLQWDVECHARVGPVVVRYPQSMAYGDGI